MYILYTYELFKFENYFLNIQILVFFFFFFYMSKSTPEICIFFFIFQAMFLPLLTVLVVIMQPELEFSKTLKEATVIMDKNRT